MGLYKLLFLEYNTLLTFLEERQMSTKKKNIPISTHKKRPLIYGLSQVLEPYLKSLESLKYPSLKERLEIYRLDKNCSQTQMIEEMGSALNTSTDNIRKWLSGAGRQIPREYVEDILRLYDLFSEPTRLERVIYTKLFTTYGSIHSTASKDEKKPNKKLSNAEKEERRKIITDAVTQYNIEQEPIIWDEIMEDENYRSAILEIFKELTLVKKYILDTYFEEHNRIPPIAWNFVKEYASLNDQGRKLIFDYMKRNFSMIEKQQVALSEEEEKSLFLLKKMTKIDVCNLNEFIKTADRDSLTKSLTESFSKKLSNLKISEPIYLEDIELYSEIEADEWEIILYFIQLGTLYNPFDENELSPVQQRAFDLIDILHEDFKLGLNIDELSPTGQYQKF